MFHTVNRLGVVGEFISKYSFKVNYNLHLCCGFLSIYLFTFHKGEEVKFYCSWSLIEIGACDKTSFCHFFHFERIA